jgi:hypothetical protein
MNNPKQFKEQDSALDEIKDITDKVERGDMPLAQAEERMLVLLAQVQQDTKRQVDALIKERATRQRNAWLALLFMAGLACAAVAFVLLK